VRLITRGGHNWTNRYPWIVEAALKNRFKQFVIDGEAVVLGVDGVADFNTLHSRRHDDEVQLYAFDILALDGDDQRKLPLSREKLQRLADELNLDAIGETAEDRWIVVLEAVVGKPWRLLRVARCTQKNGPRAGGCMHRGRSCTELSAGVGAVGEASRRFLHSQKNRSLAARAAPGGWYKR
jgi:ATP-dependent DNA ligase